jgi:hypothetical protein
MKGPAILALVAALSTACTFADGRIRGEQGPVPDWSLRPNRCTAVSGAADLFYRGPDAADTEVVVRARPDFAAVTPRLSPDAMRRALLPSVLVRLPDRHEMVTLQKTDCTVFDIAFDSWLMGHASLDCRSPEIGHVTGTLLEFACNSTN